MRVIVMSDSHGSLYQAEKIIKANPEADMFVHLGDGEAEVAALKIKYPDLDIRSVRGNCDFSNDSPNFIIIEAMGRKIFCAHGHRYHVRDGTDALVYAAIQNDCEAALFGHTHERYIAREEGIDVMNPGSCAFPRDGMKPSYGFIDITEYGIFMNIIDVGY